MPKETDRLKLPLPLGNESVTRESINGIFEKIDAGVATREDLDTLREAVSQMDIPDASLTEKGKVQLSSKTDGTSETVAATEKAVSDAKMSILSDYTRYTGYAITTGTDSAYIVTLNPVPASLNEGFGITIVPHITNTIEPTLNINGLGAFPLKMQDGTSYVAGDLLAGKPYSFRKVGSDFLATNVVEEVISNRGKISVIYSTDIEKGDVAKLITTPTLPSVISSIRHNDRYISEKGADGKTLVIHGYGQYYTVLKFETPNSAEPTHISTSTLATGETVFASSAWGDYLVLTINGLTLWELRIYKWTGKYYSKLPDPAAPVDGSLVRHCFSSDGTFLAVSSASGKWWIYRRNGDTFTKLADNSDITATGVSYTMSFSPDGKYFAVGLNNQKGFKFFKISGDIFTLVWSYGWGSGSNGRTLRNITFTPDSKYVIFSLSSTDEGPYIFPVSGIMSADTQSRIPVNVALSNYVVSGARMAIAPNGKLMITDVSGKPSGTLSLMMIDGSTFTVFPEIRLDTKGNSIGGIAFISDTILAVTTLEYVTYFFNVSFLFNAYPVSQYSQLIVTKNEGLVYALRDGNAGETCDVMQIL